MRRAVLLSMVPLNLLLLAWVWIGRGVFGVGGWFLLIYLVTIIPVMAVGLLVTTVLAYTQDERPRRLTGLQTRAQLATWAAMFGFGLVSVDFGDTQESEISPLTQVFGRTQAMLDLSYTLMYVFAGLAVVAYAVLLGALVLGRQKAA